jgi:hypothetical protein
LSSDRMTAAFDIIWLHCWWFQAMEERRRSLIQVLRAASRTLVKMASFRRRDDASLTVTMRRASSINVSVMGVQSSM